MEINERQLSATATAAAAALLAKKGTQKKTNN
jgi:hypothetical protein